MPGKKRIAAALAIGAAATAMAACGSSDAPKTLSEQDANELLVQLAAVQTAEDTGDCSAIKATAKDFVQTVNDLPETAGTDVKEELRGAGENIETLASDQTECQPFGASGDAGAETTSTTTSSTTTTTEPAPETTATTTSTTTTSTDTSTSTAPAPAPSGGGEGTGGGQPGGAGTGGGAGGGAGGGGGTGGTGTGGTGSGGGGTG